MASSTKFYNFKKRAIVFFFFENLKIWDKMYKAPEDRIKIW